MLTSALRWLFFLFFSFLFLLFEVNILHIQQKYLLDKYTEDGMSAHIAQRTSIFHSGFLSVFLWLNTQFQPNLKGRLFSLYFCALLLYPLLHFWGFCMVVREYLGLTPDSTFLLLLLLLVFFFWVASLSTKPTLSRILKKWLLVSLEVHLMFQDQHSFSTLGWSRCSQSLWPTCQAVLRSLGDIGLSPWEGYHTLPPGAIKILVRWHLQIFPSLFLRTHYIRLQLGQIMLLNCRCCN